MQAETVFLARYEPRHITNAAAYEINKLKLIVIVRFSENRKLSTVLFRLQWQKKTVSAGTLMSERFPALIFADAIRCLTGQGIRIRSGPIVQSAGQLLISVFL